FYRLQLQDRCGNDQIRGSRITPTPTLQPHRKPVTQPVSSASGQTLALHLFAFRSTARGPHRCVRQGLWRPLTHPSVFRPDQPTPPSPVCWDQPCSSVLHSFLAWTPPPPL